MDQFRVFRAFRGESLCSNLSNESQRSGSADLPCRGVVDVLECRVQIFTFDVRRQDQLEAE